MSKFGFKTYSASLKYKVVLKKGEVLKVEATLFSCENFCLKIGKMS